MRHIPLVALISTSLILGACSLPFQGTKKVADVEPRHLLPKEVIAVTPNGLSIMHPTASTDNIEYANIDADKYKEALIIFNSGGCGESDKAHLVVLKYNQEEDAWKNMTTVVLAGKQGRIESFQEKPFDITGDGINDIEIASETNGCGGAWVLSKQVFSFRDGALQDLTDKAIFSVEGGYGLIKHVDKKYEVYAKLGEERLQIK